MVRVSNREPEGVPGLIAVCGSNLFLSRTELDERSSTIQHTTFLYSRENVTYLIINENANANWALSKT